MIAGLGTDLTETTRIADAMARQSGFREMVFSANEIAYCEAKANKYEHYAARFAAKEAFFKALGTGWAEGSSFNEVEVVNNPLGKPELVLKGNTAVVVGEVKTWLSISHIKTIASAVVIIEK
ncbi:holo-ACP synthase [Mucilaginibacter sp. RS28]|uniref:Holo-[acyl-carrier-protein] synthase n=1 Tax=Mucilaginibacter straminoryzae TaxID=2932774 RepID=A0A9X1X228_9SPHI|nr:holo-ACP synthase [Mucilaginibacter straminoryzae]MCJ8208138.1 holo-ACP synthase [Mucilaginibacter straminoryzae]